MVFLIVIGFRWKNGYLLGVVFRTASNGGLDLGNRESVFCDIVGRFERVDDDEHLDAFSDVDGPSAVTSSSSVQFD